MWRLIHYKIIWTFSKVTSIFNLKNSKERKLKYNIKQTRQRTLITFVCVVTFNYTSYIDKQTGKYFIPIREILYQRLTNKAEYQYILWVKIWANLVSML